MTTSKELLDLTNHIVDLFSEREISNEHALDVATNLLVWLVIDFNIDKESLLTVLSRAYDNTIKDETTARASH